MRQEQAGTVYISPSPADYNNLNTTQELWDNTLGKCLLSSGHPELPCKQGLENIYTHQLRLMWENNENLNIA